MNHISRNKIKKKDVEGYESIRKNYEKANLSLIYNDLKNKPNIRFKNSMALRLGIPTVHECK
jgi:hypothetical protein